MAEGVRTNARVDHSSQLATASLLMSHSIVAYQGQPAAMESIGSPAVIGLRLNSAPASWTSALVRTAVTFAASIDFHRGIVANRKRQGSLPRDRAQWLQQGCQLIANRLRLEVEAYGRLPHYPCLLAANHVSYLDPIAVATQLPCSAVAKLEVGGWPGIGRVLDELGVFFVRRDDPLNGAVALRQCIRLLELGVPVLVFPEGTTSIGSDVRPFKRGAFGTAAIAGVPVVPVAVRYPWRRAAWVGSESFLSHFVRMHHKGGVTVELHFGEPIETRGVDAASLVAESARTLIRNLIVK